MQRVEKADGLKHPAPRSAWEKPSVSRMRAGDAEVGFTNTTTDGPGLSKS